MEAILIGNDNVLEVSGLSDELSPNNYLNAATVTATVKNMAGVAVSGGGFPITLSYVAASNGVYRGTIEDGVSLSDGASYIVEITADGGSDMIGFWRKEVIAQYRTF